MITIKITHKEIEELQNDQRVTVKNPEGIAEIYLSIITRMPLSIETMTPGKVNIRLGITIGDLVMLEDTGLYVGEDYELKLK